VQRWPSGFVRGRHLTSYLIRWLTEHAACAGRGPWAVLADDDCRCRGARRLWGIHVCGADRKHCLARIEAEQS
jgi:hypothetical protein